MIYPEYKRCRLKLLEALEMANRIIDEKAVLFQRTQPKGIVTDEERVSGGKRVNKTEQYLIDLEQKKIDERLQEAFDLIADRKILLSEVEIQIKESQNKYDKIYVLRYLEGKSAKEISMIMHYSESHTYRMLNKISQKLKMIENERNNML